MLEPGKRIIKLDDEKIKFDLQLFNDAVAGGGDTGGAVDSGSQASADTSTATDSGTVDNDTVDASDAEDSPKDFATASEMFENFLAGIDNDSDEPSTNEPDIGLNNTNDADDNEASAKADVTKEDSGIPEVFDVDSIEKEILESQNKNRNLETFRKLFQTEDDESSVLESVEGGDKSNETKEDVNDEELNKLSKEELMDKIYENPEEVIDDLVSEKLNAILSKREAEESEKLQKAEVLEKSFNEFAERHPDFENYKDTMLEVINETGLDLQGNPNAYEISYHIARSLNHDEIPTMPTGEEMVNQVLSDESLIEQVISNEKVTKQVISNYLNSLDGKESVATIKNSSNKGKTVINKSPKKLDTFEEAENALMKSIQ